jgi:hypothetical protein
MSADIHILTTWSIFEYRKARKGLVLRSLSFWHGNCLINFAKNKGKQNERFDNG